MPEAATRKQILDFNTLRAAGIPIVRAAEYVGCKQSWGYQQEQKRKLTGGQPSALGVVETLPRNSSAEAGCEDAVEYVVAVYEDEDDARARSLEETYGMGLMRELASLAGYLAHGQARAMQDYFLELHDEEPWFEEIKNNRITTTDILRAIPTSIDRPESLLPPRAQKWEDRLLEAHPDFGVVAEARAEAEDTDDPDEALRDLRRRIKAGDYDPEHLKEPEPVSANGTH